MTTLGKYRLIAELGRGGMATVFLAVTEGAMGINFNKLVVLKRLREHVADDPDFVTMLMDEGRIAARLNHPNVVQTLEVDKADGEFYIAMEYLDGQPLHRVLSRARDTFPVEMHLSVLADVLTGIHHAHELTDFDGTPLNVVHRDVTPHNIFVTYNGQVKVVDFGIAKAEGRASETKHGIVKGKVAYMAPEQAKGEMVDRRTDVYAVGIMLYEACTRKRMWGGKQDVDVLRALIKGKPPTSPREMNPLIPEELDRICQKSLARSPADRYQTAEEFATDLENFVSATTRRPSARELGAWVAERFKDKRELTKNVIESQLADLKDAKTATLKIVNIPQDPPSSTGLGMSADAVGATQLSASTTPTQMVALDLRQAHATAAAKPVHVEHVASPSPGEQRSRSSARVSVLVAVCLTAVAVIAVMLGTREGGWASQLGNANKPAELVSDITISVRATPNSAVFRIDDGAQLPNPYIGRFKRDGSQHRVSASAQGYEPKTQVVVFADDVSVRFALAHSVDAGP